MLREKSLVRFLLTPLAVAVILVIAATAFAQTDTGKITGTVKDQNGAIVPGANITVTNTRTGEERSAKANDDGMFSVAALKASSYRIIAEVRVNHDESPRADPGAILRRIFPVNQ